MSRQFLSMQKEFVKEKFWLSKFYKQPSFKYAPITMKKKNEKGILIVFEIIKNLGLKYIRSEGLMQSEEIKKMKIFVI